MGRSQIKFYLFYNFKRFYLADAFIQIKWLLGQESGNMTWEIDFFWANRKQPGSTPGTRPGP